LALLHKCNGSRKRRDDITVLDYSHGNLSSVPEDILLYENTLEELHLEANCLQELPKVKKSKRKTSFYILFVVPFSMSCFTSFDFIG
jgi:hypothetical protein